MFNGDKELFYFKTLSLILFICPLLKSENKNVLKTSLSTYEKQDLLGDSLSSNNAGKMRC